MKEDSNSIRWPSLWLASHREANGTATCPPNCLHRSEEARKLLRPALEISLFSMDEFLSTSRKVTAMWKGRPSPSRSFLLYDFQKWELTVGAALEELFTAVSRKVSSVGLDLWPLERWWSIWVTRPSHLVTCLALRLTGSNPRTDGKKGQHGRHTPTNATK